MIRFGRHRSIDMTSGSIFGKLVAYALPIIVLNVTQSLFHAADIAMLGIFADDTSVAAVGATSALITLITSVFLGLSTGANVVMARRVGAGDSEGASRTVGTAFWSGIISGLVLMAVTVTFARTFLLWMKCDASVIDLSVKYMQIYFMGMPIIMLYNFLAATLRASGDSLHPMTFMIIAGAVNIPLNALFILAFNMTVEGVAIATVLSKLLALILILRVVIRGEGLCKLERLYMRIYPGELRHIATVGIPSGITSMLFYMANVVVQTAVNTIGPDAMTANAISGQFDSFIYTVGCAVATACMVFVGQNMGAGKPDRINKVLFSAIGFATAVSLLLGTVFVIFSEQLLGIMTDSDAIIAIAKQRMVLLCLTYFITSIMEVFSFSLRSLGKNGVTVAVAFLCGLLLRAAWTKLVWPLNKTLGMLYLVYPVSASVAIAIYALVWHFALKKLKSSLSKRSLPNNDGT